MASTPAFELLGAGSIREAANIVTQDTGCDAYPWPWPRVAGHMTLVRRQREAQQG